MRGCQRGLAIRFDWGANWLDYARHLTPSQIARAREDFRTLFDGIDLSSKRFLDIGFGQGLALYLAQEMGAKAEGIDLDGGNQRAVAETSKHFPGVARPQTMIASILNSTFVEQRIGSYDIVHSWGVLHHTGDMNTAVSNAASMVKPGGFLVIAIYNAHWSSPLWVHIKRSFNRLSPMGQKAMVAAFCPVVITAKGVFTRQNPLKKRRRGMDFYHDLVDWVGGYPYEYASVEKICGSLESTFEVVHVNRAEVPTGCNEFVFRRRL